MYKKLYSRDNDALPISGGYESSQYKCMMDCAYVEPNEPQMIDITFITNKHVGITHFRKMIDFALRTSTLRFYC